MEVTLIDLIMHIPQCKCSITVVTFEFSLKFYRIFRHFVKEHVHLAVHILALQLSKVPYLATALRTRRNVYRLFRHYGGDRCSCIGRGEVYVDP